MEILYITASGGAEYSDPLLEKFSSIFIRTTTHTKKKTIMNLFFLKLCSIDYIFDLKKIQKKLFHWKRF